MGYDGRIGVRLSPWPRALQLPRGRGARGAAPERARGLPSVKAPGLHRIDAGGIDTVLARGEPSRAQYPGVAAEARGHILVTSHFVHSARGVLRFGPVPVGGQHRAATVSQGGQLADPFGSRWKATAPFWLSAPPTV